MPTIDLSTKQFLYLQAAVRRDLDALEEMAPWDIGEDEDGYEREVRMCRAMIRILRTVEQTQVTTH
jgi:hypothetical protein